MFKIPSQIYLGKAKPSSGGGGGASLPDQTGKAGKFLTTDGTNPSWADVLPAFPAPSETVSTVAYTAAGGTSGITGKELQSITFDANDTALFHSSVSGDKSLSFYIGQGSTYDSTNDILLTFNFTVENGVVSYAELVPSLNGSQYSPMVFIQDSDYVSWDTSTWAGYFNIYYDSTKKKIWAQFNFKAYSLTDIADVVDSVLLFEVLTQTNALPAASSYANKLAYVYETGTYSDIKNLIYSNGTNWQFLPGAVLQIPDERMWEAANKLTPAYCGIPLTTGQLAIPCRNKTYDADNDNKNDISNNYSIGQMHEFNIDSSSWLNRWWTGMNFGPVFTATYQYLVQSEASDYADFYPNCYYSNVFENAGQTTNTQRVIVHLSNSSCFCYAVFGQGTNKIQLEFDSATNAKVFLNGQAVNTANNLVLDADSKTYVANFYDYTGNSGYIVMDIKELPYNPANKVIALSSSTATLETNTDYTATVSGSATFTLPTPSDATKENTINILLNATATSFITWQNAGGFTLNVNTCLTSFSIGKYLIRLMYDNNSAQWFGEVLKGEDTISPVKLLLHFDGNYTDSSASPITLTANTSDTNFPVYITGKFANTQALRGYTNRYFTQSTNSKLNLGTGDFTVCFWFKTDKTASNTQNDDVFYSSQYSKMSALKLYLGTISNNIGIDPSNYSTPSDWHYIAYTRSGNNLYYFIDGVYKATKQYSGSIDFSSARIAQFTSTNGYSYIQDLLVKDTCDYSGEDKTIGDSVFNPPTAPYVISEQSLSDYHDDTKQDVLTSITGYDASKTQVLKNVQGVLTWVDEA